MVDEAPCFDGYSVWNGAGTLSLMKMAVKIGRNDQKQGESRLLMLIMAWYYSLPFSTFFSEANEMAWRSRFRRAMSFNQSLDWELNSLYTEIVSPARFLELFATKRDAIRSTRFLPPKLGDDGFGRVLIVWKYPVSAIKALS